MAQSQLSFTVSQYVGTGKLNWTDSQNKGFIAYACTVKGDVLKYEQCFKVWTAIRFNPGKHLERSRC